ncbi:hypothetical protein Hdeb2414_s0009g00314911 [Helianthus debilis subsp. tardiflorus]
MNHLTIVATYFMVFCIRNKNQLMETPLMLGLLVVMVIISMSSHTRLPLCSRFMIYITIGLYRVKFTMRMVLG